MKKKYYILALTFLCLFLGQVSYGITTNEGDDDEFCFDCVNELEEVVITPEPKDEEPEDSGDPCDASSSAYDYCTCHYPFCEDTPPEDNFPDEDCPSGDYCECYGIGCDVDPPPVKDPCTNTCDVGFIQKEDCSCIKKEDDDCKESKMNTDVPGNSNTYQVGDTVTFNGPFYFSNFNQIPKGLLNKTETIIKADLVAGYQILEHGNYYEIPSLSYKYNQFSDKFHGGTLGGFFGEDCPNVEPNPGDPNPGDPNFDETDYGNSGSFEQPELKNWYIDQDKDGFESTSEKAENSPGGEYIEGISKGKDCDDTIWNADNINCNLKKPWYLDNDNDAWHSQAKQAEISPGANWKETTSGVDCNDARYSLINDCSTADPCAEIKNILNHEAPDPNTKDLKPNINRLEDVVEAAVNDKEEGFEISKRMNADETYRYEFDIAQTGLKFEIEMQTGGYIIGTFHSHPSDGVAMFSFQDLKFLLDLYNNAKPQYIQDVFTGLVAKDEQGNTNVYILKVDDIAKLQKLVEDTWTDPNYASITNDKDRREAIHLVQAKEYAKESDKEKSFLEQFPRAGISVYKADATLSNFSKLILTNGHVAKTPCN